jgi:hypothetical protein
MDQYITVTSSDQHPCKFVSNFAESINLNDGYEVAVTRIFHAPLHNVTQRNRKFTLIKGNSIVDHFIPIGYYMGSCDVLNAIYNELLLSLERGDNGTGVASLIRAKPQFIYDKGYGEASSLKIMDTGVNFLIDNDRDDDSILLKMLGYCVNSRFDKITINHYSFHHQIEAGFLYSNIVDNSIINQQKSRLLAIVPVTCGPGYNYHEFTNPIYNPLSLHSFTDINFILSDVHGETMSLDAIHSTYWGSTNIVIYPTIITLHIRRVKN